MKGWKTIIFSALIALLGVAETANWVDLAGDQWGGIILIIVGVISAYLRKVTNTPVGKKST